MPEGTERDEEKVKREVIRRKLSDQQKHKGKEDEKP